MDELHVWLEGRRPDYGPDMASQAAILLNTMADEGKCQRRGMGRMAIYSKN